MFKSERLDVRLTFTEPLLGTAPARDLYERWIQAEARKRGLEVDDELETLQDMEEKGWTRFHEDEKGLLIYDYVVRGFLKSALAFLMENGAVPKIPAYKNRVDKFVFIEPRRIYIKDSEGRVKTEPDGVLERPLRAMTLQGPRTSLVRSDYVKPGSMLEFSVILFENRAISMRHIRQAFDYGRWHGLGQWASGGFGRFSWEEINHRR